MADRFIAMIPLERAVEVDPAEVIAAFDRLFPGLAGTLVWPGSNDANDNSGGGIYLLEGMALPVMVIDKPIPAGTMDHAIGATRMWDDPQAMNRHQGHVIVSSFGETEAFEGAIKSARAVTLLSAAILKATPAIGIYWTTGETVTKPDMFIESAQRLATDSAPLESRWVQYYWLGAPPQDGKPTLAVITTGLKPFIGRELEFKPTTFSPIELAQRIIGTVGYLLMNGPVVGDGDTLGISQKEHIRARYRDRGQRPDIPVISMKLEATDNGRLPGLGG
jgi:hypothetical protein